MKNIRQIADIYNINHATVAKRVESLKLVPIRKIWRANYYHDDDVKKIIEYKRDFITDRKKLLIVEYYLMFKYVSAGEIAVILNIKFELVKSIINEFIQNDNYIIIESKL